MSEHKRISRNMGRIELLAVRDTVKAMLEAGYDGKKIHCRLREEGRVTMSYPTFCYQFKQQFAGNTANPASGANQARRPGTPGMMKAGKSAPFSIDSKPTLEKFH